MRCRRREFNVTSSRTPFSTSAVWTWRIISFRKRGFCVVSSLPFTSATHGSPRPRAVRPVRHTADPPGGQLHADGDNDLRMDSFERLDSSATAGLSAISTSRVFLSILPAPPGCPGQDKTRCSRCWLVGRPIPGIHHRNHSGAGGGLFDDRVQFRQRVHRRTQVHNQRHRNQNERRQAIDDPFPFTDR